MVDVSKDVRPLIHAPIKPHEDTQNVSPQYAAALKWAEGAKNPQVKNSWTKLKNGLELDLEAGMLAVYLAEERMCAKN